MLLYAVLDFISLGLVERQQVAVGIVREQIRIAAPVEDRLNLALSSHGNPWVLSCARMMGRECCPRPLPLLRVKLCSK